MYIYVLEKKQLLQQFINQRITQRQLRASYEIIDNDIQQLILVQRLENFETNILHERSMVAIKVLDEAKEAAFIRLMRHISELSEVLSERSNLIRQQQQNEFGFSEPATAE